MKQEIQTTIQTVIKRLAYKYTFGPYEVEDIEQEAWIICLELLDKWDGIRPLENFLMISLKNALINFKRNNYCRQENGEVSEAYEKKRMLMNRAEEYFDIKEGSDDFSQLFTRDEISFYLDKLPPNIRNDFQRLAHNVSIPTSRKTKVYEAIRQIYEENRETL